MALFELNKDRFFIIIRIIFSHIFEFSPLSVLNKKLHIFGWTDSDKLKGVD